MILVLIAVGLLLAFANGANDNFKGVATLLGSHTTSYRRALRWATVTTALGSATALVLAGGLLAAFSGKGLVPPEVAVDPGYALAVALAAGSTVLLATRFGLPVSTTHALIGGLVGAGLFASPSGVDVGRLGSQLALPLLSSPFIAIGLTAVLYPALRRTRRRLRIDPTTCVCVGRPVVRPAAIDAEATPALRAVGLPTVTVGPVGACGADHRGGGVGVTAAATTDVAHFVSAGIVSFARGLNDTPKIAALLLVVNAVTPGAAIVAVAILIGVGGFVAARRVAETMAHRVTTMTPGQGLTANLVTGILVVGASTWSLPVSTTHVSCGALFGIGAVTRKARWGTVAQILLAWVVTLPLAAGVGALAYAALGGM